MPSPRLSGLLIDLSGTLHVGDTPTPRAVAALQKLRASQLPIRFCSNTTKESSASLVGRLRRIGFEIDESEVFTSLSASRRLVEERGLKPYLLISDSALEDFKNLRYPDEECDSVVVGLAPERLSYENGLNTAFRILSREPVTGSSPRPDPAAPRTLIATHQATYVRSSSGALSLGPGPFVQALSSASGIPSEVVGKPSQSFFELTLRSMKDLDKGAWPSVGIVGDDVTNDLGDGALALGLKRFLVKTGKYREGDEDKVEQPPDGVYASFADLVDDIC